MTSLFLSQSYKDTWDDYNRSLTNENFSCWDYIVLTASNEHQAESFRAQIRDRQQDNFLPSRTRFIVIPDEDGKRIGSGGATLSVIKRIAEEAKTTDFSGLKILVIHSGGDSKRIPQYSALGKLFSPIPRELPNGRASTLFDELMIIMSSAPARVREGMLLLSGDVLLLFNPLQIDYSGNGAAVISFKEKVETGKNHGVFLCGEDGSVKKFLHKQSVETLKSQGAVNDNGSVDIDTGAIIFSPKIVKSLYSLISSDNKFDSEKYNALVNDKVRLSLYGDFLYPLATESTLAEFYKEKPEGIFSKELKDARKKVWQALSDYKTKLIRIAPAKFIHFGTTSEVMSLMCGGVKDYSYLDWTNKVNSSIENQTAGYNSVLSGRAKIGKNCYLEVSYVHHDAKVGDNCFISYIDVKDVEIPSNVVLHGLKQENGSFVARIYGINDNPKNSLEDNCAFLGTTLKQFMKINGLTKKDLWDDKPYTLWNAKLYSEKATISEALNSALNLYNMANGKGDAKEFKNSIRKSLCSGFNEADSTAVIDWNNRMEELVHMDGIVKLIRSKTPATQANKLLHGKPLTKIQKEWLEKRLKTASFSEAMRLRYYIGVAIGGSEGDKYLVDCFKYISQTILKHTLDDLKYNDKCKIVKDKHSVKLPLRVNLGGGWSDTPPFCCENGGTVLNAAITLNGEKPVEVKLEKIKELKIVFDSRDMDVHGEFTDLKELQKTGDPFDPFALQKAGLLACGIIPKKGGNLKQILKRLGGGFIMHSEVTNVPKGSGLGTSSILSATCVKAIFEFMGIEHTEDDLYSHVLCMEQIMSTGGGWQDQVGGVTNGIKYITSKPGLNQKLKVTHVEIAPETLKELNDRFVLIYTGQRRLARNLLRDVVGRYVGNIPDSLQALQDVQKTAALMKFELERDNVDGFAKLLNEHWELSKKIDAGSTNTLIDQIFASIEEYIDGKLVVGAGGGGFLQAILKKGVDKQEVRKRLKEVFQDSSIDIWDSELI